MSIDEDDDVLTDADLKAAQARWADPSHEPTVAELFSRPVYGDGFRGDVPLDLTRRAPLSSNRSRRGRNPKKFSEAVMDREAMIHKLSSEHGIESSILEKLDDPTLAAWLRSVDDTGDTDDVLDEDETDDMDDLDGIDEEANGHEGNKGTPAKNPDTDYLAEDEETDDMDDLNEVDEETVPAKKPCPAKMRSKPMKYSERQIQRLIAQGVAKELGKQSKAISRIQKFSERQLVAAKKSAQAQKRARIDDEFKALFLSGQVIPAEVDAGLKALAYVQNDSRVLKFSEVKDGKKVERTETQLDTFLRVLKNRPPIVKLGERFGSPARPESSEGDEVAIVKAHVEKFSEQYKASGVDTSKIVEQYKALTEAQKKQTLAEYKKQLGIAS